MNHCRWKDIKGSHPLAGSMDGKLKTAEVKTALELNVPTQKKQEKTDPSSAKRIHCRLMVTENKVRLN